MSKFNIIKTSFVPLDEDRKQIGTSRELKARVVYVFKSLDPKRQNLFYIKASIISVRTENQITIEPTVVGTANQMPPQEFLLNEATNITVIPFSEELPVPNSGDEIIVDVVVSEITKELNIDGYYKRIIKSINGPAADSESRKIENLQAAFNGTNSLSNSDFELPPIAPVSKDQKDYNPQVLQLANSISGYTYLQGHGTGIPFGDLMLNGQIAVEKDLFVYCSGYTFYVCYTIASQAGLFKDKTLSDVRKFKANWYGYGGEKNLLSGNALTKFGIGINVSWDDAKPGDFCQIWRISRSGHSVIFLGWIFNDDGEKIGITYRAAGSSGVGNSKEYFLGKNPKKPNSTKGIDKNRLFFSRLIIQ